MWSAIDAFAKQGISFLIGLVLARLLFPSDYGLVGMLGLFMALSQSFIDCGFSNALICKHDRDDDDCSTAFWFNFAIGIVAYIVLFITAPYIAKFYNESVLTPLTRTIGLAVFFNSMCIVQNALLTSSLKIKVQTKIAIICQISTGVFAIALAYYGWGVWALALQSVASSLLNTILLWRMAKWRPKFVFSVKSFRYLWRFGSKMLFVGLISNTYSNIHTFVIGKFFTKSELGLFAKASSFAKLIPNTLYSVVNKVSLPSLSALSQDKERLKDYFRMYMRVSAAIVFPIIGGLIVLAKPTVLVLWTSKWEGSILLIQILCLGSVWNTLNLLTISVMQIIQHPEVVLKYEIINKIVGALIIICTIPLGFLPIICGRALYNLYEYLFNTNCTRKYIGYRLVEQFSDVFVYVVITGVTMLIVYVIIRLFGNEYVQLFIGITSGIVCYAGLLYIFHVKAISDIAILCHKLRTS